MFRHYCTATLLVLPVDPTLAQNAPNSAPDPTAQDSPYLKESFPDQALFGGSHLHTAYSADAGLVGARSNLAMHTVMQRARKLFLQWASQQGFSARLIGWSSRITLKTLACPSLWKKKARC